MSLDEGNKHICHDVCIRQLTTFRMLAANRAPEIQVNVSTDFRASDAVLFLTLNPMLIAGDKIHSSSRRVGFCAYFFVFILMITLEYFILVMLIASGE